MGASTGAVVALVLGIAGVLVSGYQILRAWRARQWPSVHGIVAGVQVLSRSDGDGGSRLATYVSYRYEVDGRPFRNDGVRFGFYEAPRSILPDAEPAPRTAAQFVAAEQAGYTAGENVIVFYNPADPADSVLVREPNASALLTLAAGAVVVMLAVSALAGG